jgi:hypothetical protein
VVNATVYDNLNFNFTRDIVPVAGVMNTSHVMVVHPLASVHPFGLAPAAGARGAVRHSGSL